MIVKENKTLSLALLVLVLLNYSNTVAGDPLITGLFVFGDSLVDVGNNNYLSSIAKANYYPYGVDFEFGTTGRFSNGKTFVDFLARMLGVPYPPAFADPNTNGARILGGVNYASAAAGILDESGQHYGQRYTLSQQVLNFETNTLNQLRSMMGASKLTDYLAKSISILAFGSNDYINNYLLSTYPSQYTYTPQQFANLLLNRYARQLLALYSVGLRKFLVAGIGPLGCIPNQRAQAPSGRCNDYANQILGTFNEGLKPLMDELNKRCPGAIFVSFNTYAAVGDILNNPATFGFNTVDRACCGIGRSQGQITCLPYVMPCFNRNQFVFWDAFHPTDAVNAILARKAAYGSSMDYWYPFNLLNITLNQ
ncbi:GDSL esterase/lipase At1g71250-like [Pistacia vera]|uniref:GDSL esterase/lipase At1g71250-like n=1 Tax=Pistacia vera TaxID=55513 RepID=UPI001262C92E|nr:GDSL esterase/lipase At1g71250-like [Pistacia vera]